MSYIADGHHLIAPRDTLQGMKLGALVKGENTPSKPTRVSKTNKRFDWLLCPSCGELLNPANVKMRNGKLMPVLIPEHTPPRGEDVCETSGTTYEGTVITC